MPKYEKFEDLPAWQEGARLYNAVLDLLETSNPPFTPGFRAWPRKQNGRLQKGAGRQ